MIVAVPTETFPNERRVALVPTAAAHLIAAGHEVRVQSGAGVQAGYPDDSYREKGVAIVDDRGELLNSADLIAQIRVFHATDERDRSDVEKLRSGQILVGLADARTAVDSMKLLAERGLTVLAMELMPRITRAQDMDVLSSQASLAGYKAVLRAADMLPRIFPLMMTAAGTLKPARVFVVGVGVAGLQAIATAKRLGAHVSAYDVRPAVKEQVHSLGAVFVELPIDTSTSQDAGGYAKAQSEEQVKRQQNLMTETVAESDVVITTALIPAKRAPILVTKAMVEAMSPKSVIVDLAAERGGNCELTQPGKTIEHNGVMIVGDDHLISGVAYHASQMFANNLTSFLKHLTKDGRIAIDTADEITAATLVTRDGKVVHPQVREAIDSPPQT
jgi:NAD(P) transhydrogenase subunit alpha